jgi:hypothetical protein
MHQLDKHEDIVPVYIYKFDSLIMMMILQLITLEESHSKHDMATVFGTNIDRTTAEIT